MRRMCVLIRRRCGRLGRRSVGQRRSGSAAVAPHRRRRRVDGQREWREGEEDSQGADGVHRPPAQHARAELRATEVPERAGPHGAGVQTEPQRHAGQDLVPEPQVREQTAPVSRNTSQSHVDTHLSSTVRRQYTVNHTVSCKTRSSAIAE